ncbi:G-protein coupled receptor 84 [Salarias fasciatus]|uniref:G-protein coupled receptor 84 n=1 Tax=Salarias fasciatus TaxID=181472 RepID=UPI001176A0B1|nr:G-protein coupled receptor 84 [Salarias fasciatus]
MLMNQTNHTEEDLFSCYSPSAESYRYFAVLWGCVVTVTGTVGNIMTVLAFVFDSHLRSRFNALIVNLAVADLLYCTVLQPASVDAYLHLRWRGGQLWCSVFGLLLFLSNSVSIITLCLVAVSRYLLVARRAVFVRVFSKLGLILLLISSWTLGLISFAPLWSVYVFVPQVCTCSFHRTEGRPYSTIVLFLYFFVGLSCVGVFYLLIYRHVLIASKALLRYRLSRRSSRRKPTCSAEGANDSGVAKTSSSELSSQAEISQHEESTCENMPQSTRSANTASIHHSSTVNTPTADIVHTVVSVAPAPVVVSSSHSDSKRDDSEIKHVTHMCFAVFLCFVFCFVPFLLLNIADKHNRAPQILHMFCANLTWLNSCINPVLYAVMNRQFRQAYFVLLSRVASPFTCRWARF